MSFSWIPFYRELAMRLLEYESKQGELIAFLADLKKKGRKVIPLMDYANANQKGKTSLTEIDPFTFCSASITLMHSPS